ncbi:hypothetical protein L7F22_003752 [Adiantum nelumboides]|nr:hypothetical protein [Adiantum nelumboides]
MYRLTYELRFYMEKLCTVWKYSLKMDLWTFIAAAGSGYFAQFWKSSQNLKGAFGGITQDDDDHSSSPSHTMITRKCYCIPSLKRSSAKTRFHQKRHGAKLLGGCLTTNLHTPLVDDSASLGILALHNGIGEDARSSSSLPTQSEKHHDPALCHSTSGSNNTSRNPGQSSFNDLWPQKCCDFIPDGNKASSNSTVAFPDNCGFYLSNLYSKACLDPCRISEVHGGCSIRQVEDKEENTVENELQALPSIRTCITGCLHQYEHVCTTTSGDISIMQVCEVESSKKIRSLQDNERGGSFTKRRRSLTHCRPIMCPSSYISAQMGNDCRQEMKCGYEHISLAHTAPLRQRKEKSGIIATSSHQLVGDKISDFTSSRNMSSKVLDNINLPNLVGRQIEGTSLEGGLPLYCNEGRKEAREDGSCGDGFWLKGNHLAKTLLLNFGVGVGMMFAIMSSKHTSQQILWELEEVMSALKNLEEEIQAIRHGLDNNGDAREKILPEQSPSPLQNSFGLVEPGRVSLVKDSETDCDCSLERARIEAEVEAELERMESDFSFKSIEFSGQHSWASEEGLGIGNELSTRHIICGDNDNISHALSANANIFSHELIHYRNCAVPPEELAKRLYELLEIRQEEKILELEAEIKRLENGLQAKEQQSQAWKQLVRQIVQETACINLSSCQKDLFAELENTSVKDLSSSTSVENLFVAGLERPGPFFSDNEDISFSFVDTALSTYPSIPQMKNCSDGEAWLHPLNNSYRDSPRQQHDGCLKHADEPKDLRSIMKAVEPEVMDVSYGSVSSCSSNNAVLDILGSAPCLITSVGNQHKSDVEVKTNNKQEYFSLDWNRNSKPYPDTVRFSEDRFAQDVMVSQGSCGQILEWNSSEGSCNSSDLDEQLGQKLIKHIVQKGRKGVLMVEAAKSILATFDLDNTSLDVGIPSG